MDRRPLAVTGFLVAAACGAVVSGCRPKEPPADLVIRGKVATVDAAFALEWVRSRIMVRISTRLDTLLGARLYDASFRQALFSGGMNASAQPLSDLTGLRQFLTGNGLFAFFDAPWVPVLPNVKASSFEADKGQRVQAWRWELELLPRAKNPRIKPLFTFIAVPATAPKP